MVLNPAGRSSQTDFKVVKRFQAHTDIEFYPKTGRTHQIRIHAVGIGHPVTGDAVYGRPSPIAPRQMLHAWKLTLRHPSTKKELKFVSPLPKDFQRTLKLCKKSS
jgi:23S rRNA pseudouridine1911/1915/1917 synthase